MGKSVCGLLQASQPGEGTDKIGWHCNGGHGLAPYAWPSDQAPIARSRSASRWRTRALTPETQFCVSKRIVGSDQPGARPSTKARSNCIRVSPRRV
jgi:hypothetical protein